MEKITIKVPRGTKNNAILRYQGYGEKRNKMAGDLLVRVREIPHQQFLRDEDDIIFTKKLSLKDALLGTKIEIEKMNKKFTYDFQNEVISPDTVKM